MEAVKCEAFLAAAELGSLTATAELLGYTQSGVTRMIGTLEEELGFPLFLRSKKGVQLTENGKLMLPLLREVVRAHHNAEQLSAEIGGVSKGSLTIGCYYSISALWMPEILTAFRARYPGVTVRMQEGGNLEMARWLNERSVDCCFGAQMHGDKYDWLPVFRDELVAWLPRGHELAEADAFPLMRLQNEPFIHTSPNHDTDQDRLLEQHDLHPQTCFTTRDGFTTYNMVEAGLGVSFNQRLISRKWSGTVAEVPFDPPAVRHARHLRPVAQRGLARSEKVHCLRHRDRHGREEKPLIRKTLRITFAKRFLPKSRLFELGGEGDLPVVHDGADGAVVPLGDRARDGKADAKAAARRAGLIGTVKAVEELLRVFRRDILAGVRRAEDDTALRLFEREFNGGIRQCIFDRVVEQDRDELAHGVLVAAIGEAVRDRKAQLVPLRRGEVDERFRRFAHGVAHSLVPVRRAPMPVHRAM